MANRKRPCKHCKKYVDAVDGVKFPVGFFCSIDHAIACAKQAAKTKGDRALEAKRKAGIKKHRERKRAIRPKSWYTKDAQKWFNKFIRLRDAGDPCISCGRHHDGQYHAGHYKTVGAHPELRFFELNCHKQCAPCNNHLSGNIVNYRIRLINKIGAEHLEAIESHHASANLTISDLEFIASKYKKKCKELIKQQSENDHEQ